MKDMNIAPEEAYYDAIREAEDHELYAEPISDLTLKKLGKLKSDESTAGFLNGDSNKITDEMRATLAREGFVPESLRVINGINTSGITGLQPGGSTIVGIRK